MNRVGIGQDSHHFEKKLIKPLILGGVEISKDGGLKGNSDGDLIIHSLCNALSSAIGGESLSTWSDEMCIGRGISDSREYLKIVFDKVKNLGYFIENISIAVEAQVPRLTAEQKKEVKESLAFLLKIETDQIGITYTSGENLTAFGKEKGMQVFAIVNLRKDD